MKNKEVEKILTAYANAKYVVDCWYFTISKRQKRKLWWRRPDLETIVISESLRHFVFRAENYIKKKYAIKGLLPDVDITDKRKLFKSSLDEQLSFAQSHLEFLLKAFKTEPLFKEIMFDILIDVVQLYKKLKTKEKNNANI